MDINVLGTIIGLQGFIGWLLGCAWIVMAGHFKNRGVLTHAIGGASVGLLSAAVLAVLVILGGGDR